MFLCGISKVLRMQKLTGKTFLLTGGAGFIGASLARRLIDDNEVVIYDNGLRGKLPSDLAEHPNLRFIQGDVLDFDSVKAAMQGVQYVVHLAAIAGVDSVTKMAVQTMKVALLGTYHALEAAVAE